MLACRQSKQETLIALRLCDPQLGFGGFAADSERFVYSGSRLDWIFVPLNDKQ
jgi:hypothetical protein